MDSFANPTVLKRVCHRLHCFSHNNFGSFHKILTFSVGLGIASTARLVLKFIFVHEIAKFLTRERRIVRKANRRDSHTRKMLLQNVDNV